MASMKKECPAGTTPTRYHGGIPAASDGPVQGGSAKPHQPSDTTGYRRIPLPLLRVLGVPVGGGAPIHDAKPAEAAG